MIRPWYRSRLFWLGVPGFVFLLWCWWDSTRCETQIYLCQDGIQLVHARGEVWILWWDDLSDRNWRYFYAERNWPYLGCWSSWDPWSDLTDDPNFGGVVKVRHSALALSYGGIGFAAVIFWQYRKHRRNKALRESET